MRWRDILFLGLLAGAVGQMTVGLWWHALRFPRLAFFDNGWPLTTDALLDAGLVPTRDFAYTYGLSSLLVNRAAFALFGATPHTTALLVLVPALLTLAGVWRLVAALDLGWLARVAVLAVVPLLFPLIDFPSPTHTLEAALLVFALAEQARSRPERALALAAAAATVKPALGYVYGLVLVARILSAPGVRMAERVQGLIPAVAVGGAILTVLIARFGLTAVLATQLPGNARAEYDDLGCGFFAPLGKPFWLPVVLGDWNYFAESPFGIWCVSTLLLLAGAVAGARRWRTDPAAGMLFALAVWQVTFVLTAFGNGGAWIYYPYVPFVGGAVALDRLPRWLGGRVGWPLAIGSGAAVVALAVQPAWRYVELSLQPRPPHCQPEEATGGLYAFPDEAAAWQRVRALAAVEPVFVVSRMGGAPALFPDVTGPKSWYLSQPLATPAERVAVADGMRRARWLAVSTFMTDTLPAWVTDAAGEAGFDLNGSPAFASSPHERPVFRVYRRTGP